MEGNKSKEQLRARIRSQRSTRAESMPDVAEVAWRLVSSLGSPQSPPTPGSHPNHQAHGSQQNPSGEGSQQSRSADGSGRAASAPTMLAYAALRGEPSLDSCIDRFLAAGGRVFLPVVTEVGRPLVFGEVVESMRTLRPRGRWGIREPEAQLSAIELMSPELGLDVVFVPALGFGEHGARLGNGGGFYDRTFGPLGEVPLSEVPSGEVPVGEVRSGEVPVGEVGSGESPQGAVPRPALYGVCFSDEIGLQGLRVEPWDLRITQAVAEDGVHPFR